MKKLLFFIFLVAGHSHVFAQYSRYIIQLKDKAGSPFTVSNPSQFLSQRSIARRARYNLPIDQTDIPVTPAYLDSIRIAGNVSILNTSKWLNQVCVQTTDAVALAKINSYSFVVKSSPIGARTQPISVAVHKQMDGPHGPVDAATARPLNPADLYNYGVAYDQVNLHSTEFLHNYGFSGNGMWLALLDAGFYHYQTLPTFDSIRNHNQILGTWDFVANEESVNEDDAHGMDCLSTIAANLPGSFVGTSPKSSFYLFRTEDVSSEYPVEEQNWAAAAEKADSLGVDIFSVSLGYNQFDNSSFNYTYSDMDGNTTLIARASNLAAKKGILVVVAAGNEGNGSWKYITTPGDADSVLTVGAVNASRQVASFSGYGPSADGQIKPDVAAIGWNAVVADPNTGAPAYGNGTSFACPIMAGMVSCLWQAFPEVNNMAIIDALRKSSDRATTPDDRTGYGIPDAKKAFVLLIKRLYGGQQINVNDSCKAIISGSVKAGANMSLVLERKLPGDLNYTAISTANFGGNFSISNFNYTDDLSTLPAGTNIKYRFKMNIGADTSFYLDSAAINFDRACTPGTEKISISPNPVSDQLSILISANNSKAAVILHSISGQKVYSGSWQINGVQRIMVPMKQMSRGIYFITVLLNDKKELVRKIVRE